ncbi:MAG: DUF3667 domain-containing protein [Spirosomataceae bacterium]
MKNKNDSITRQNLTEIMSQNNIDNPGKLKRIDGNYIIHEITHVLHFEKGIFYTIRELLTKPGETVRIFITKDRSRIVKPIIFIIVTSLTYTIVSHYFHVEDKYITFSDDKPSTIGKIFKWIGANYGYSNIIMAMFIAFWAKIFFKKFDYNFFEILILLCFVMGIGMLIFAVFAIFQGLTHVDLMQVASFVSFGYATWAIGQFFDKTKFVSYFKAFASYFLGFFTFAAAAILLGILIDFIP